jgi:glycosyltransferase involved in cell wall biosynthesis
MRLLVDVSQYVSWPATSGVQRVIGRLAREWPDGDVEPWYGYLEDKRYVTGDLRVLGSLIESTFAGSTRRSNDIANAAAEICASLREQADGSVDGTAVAEHFDGFLLPEPTLRSDSLHVAAELLRTAPKKVHFLYFDSLPLTRPSVYPRRADDLLRVSRYHLLVARGENVAFISNASKREFERRLARRTIANTVVATPGADAVLRRRRDPSVAAATFVIVGTVEPRKGHRMVLDAFERMWSDGRDYKLVVLGAPGWERTDLFERLRRHDRSGRVKWRTAADDGAIALAYSQASALVFVSEYEGYGLPPLEALSSGCPIIVSEHLPALERLPRGGQIRLSDVTAEGIREAVEMLADPAENRRYREAIATVRLPTWNGFVRRIERWVAAGSVEGPDEVVSRSRSTTAGSRIESARCRGSTRSISATACDRPDPRPSRCCSSRRSCISRTASPVSR